MTKYQVSREKVYDYKRVVLLRREISLKVTCESQIFNLFFAIIFLTMKGHTSKLLINIVSDVQTERTVEENTVTHNYPKIAF